MEFVGTPTTRRTLQFCEMFLDEYYGLLDIFCKTLEELPWMWGDFGVSSGNDEMPWMHMYITVDDTCGKTNEQMRQEINTKFGWAASVYIELRRKVPKEANFIFL